jgi:hypothetical protein
MQYGGQQDVEWLSVQDPEGNTNLAELDIFDHSVGCHTGDYIALNIPNPLPGFEYMWLLNPKRPNSHPSDHFAIARMQGKVLTAEDPEFAPLHLMEGVDRSFLDNAIEYRELVAVRIPEEVIRRRNEEHMEKNMALLRRGPAEDFVSRAGDLERTMYGKTGPTRFRRSDHQTEFDEGGQTKELHQPDSGIVRTVD